MSLGTIGLAFLAGILSILSPCVLPLLPIVLGSAASEHRYAYAPLALAMGLALSFVIIGIFVATIGFAISLDAGVFRAISAVLLIGLGVPRWPPPEGRCRTGWKGSSAASPRTASAASSRSG
jgi:cytochrome c-type biogenesis protein